MNQNSSSRFTPILLALCLVAGILIGTFYANHFSGNRLNIINTNSNKVNDLLRIIDDQYVDTVNMTELVEQAMPRILAELDPHSGYIRAKDAEASVESLKGSFSGIGVSFTKQNDTARIISVIKGGPSEKVGLLAGDRIVNVDGKDITAKEITAEDCMKLMKGKKGTKVKLGIQRMGEKKPLYYTITRGDIPVHSIEATYMLTPETGYVKIKSFSETTYPELLVALAELNQKGFKNLVIDLRDNTGGIMQTAIQMANIFLPKNRLILYTEGRKFPREEYKSDGRGAFPNLPLTVLVNEGSASASEIFAGAIQDNDRGTIIGRRTYGKGLVQQPIEFRDGSMIRLTIARYYTPSGRCIQKPYEKGHGEEYENDLIERYERGEFFSQDSIKQSGQTLLNQFIPVYLGVLLSPEYSDYLGEIIIEGHTDTSGDYLMNLELSQERALSVATYCLQMPQLTKDQLTLLRSILTAKGRSYSDPIYGADGKIDMDASRRVEFKFRLKDSEMIDEMRDILKEYEAAEGGSQ